jgi:tripartite-type tricarboxylate transporter receptor subunit TctC
MKLPRRAFLYLAAGTAAVLAVSQISWAQISWAQIPWAQAYPSRPVRIMVGFPPGGPADVLARLLGQRLSERLGQPFIIENRPGASGNIATEAVTRAPGDGHTLLLVVPGNAVSDLLSDRLNFSFMRDTAPVAGISNGPLVMEINPAIPVHTVPEFIAYTQDRPGKVNFASPGTVDDPAVRRAVQDDDRRQHGSRALSRQCSCVDRSNRRSGQLMFVDTPSSIGHVRSGKLRALAVTTAVRSEILPEAPTVSEFLPGFEASNWFGVAAPKSTPPEIVDKLNKEINVALAEPELKARLADLGAAALAGSPADFGKFIAAEAEKWSKVIRAANIKVD